MPRTIRKVSYVPKLMHQTRVAAYARVSSGKDAMLHSLSSQVSYYSNLIQSHEGWQYVGVYSDEAMTGTKDNRADFQRLLADCRAGKIDLILTKSISRFARNTVILLETVRKLKVMGVDIYFEEQNIHTMSADGELMLTILASYAQEESLSASENQKWRIRKGFENGELLNWRFMFGYHIEKGRIEIDPETAEIVREVFRRAIGGDSFGSIAKDLNNRQIPCTLGGRWCTQRIHDLNSNEKYLGNALLQKHYRNNHLEKKKCTNNGELPRYYAKDTHDGIIDEETFAQAQEVLQHLAQLTCGRKIPFKSVFTGMINCVHCGRNYKRTVSNGKIGWNCSIYLQQGKNACWGKKIPEDTLVKVTVEALGCSEFDPTVFSERIHHIEVPEANKLVFCFKSGGRAEYEWQDRSRSESWTNEMKEAARQRAIQQRREVHVKGSNSNSRNEE